MVGQVVKVLFERKGRLADQMVGKSDHLHAVHVADAGLSIGDFQAVRITESGSNSLGGVLA